MQMYRSLFYFQSMY